jgi:hypothetical protein
MEKSILTHRSPQNFTQNFTQNLSVDVVIVGGGIAGLMIFRRLRNLGFTVILLEKEALGVGQTLASQGIIHGGSKYALQGKVSDAAKTVAQMTAVWSSYFNPDSQDRMSPDWIDLTGVKRLSPHHYLWSSGFGAALKTLISSKVLSSENRVLKPTEYPEIFQNPDFSGSLCELDEVVLDTQSLLKNLVGRDQNFILKIDETFVEQCEFENTGSLKEIRLTPDISLTAKTYIFAAGAGNQSYLERALERFKQDCASQSQIFPRMQLRPLKMVMVKHPALRPVYAHYVGSGILPELTITSHELPEGGWIWYLGGVIAETGVNRSNAEQYQAAAKLLKQRFSWLDLTGAEYAVLDISRAEIFNHGKRPDHYGIGEIGNTFFVWPTKLTLAPALAQTVLDLMGTRREEVGHTAHSVSAEAKKMLENNMEKVLENFPKALLGRFPWEEAQWEKI